jgi:sugar/nucleoside kinase (ribokinase family)
VKKGNVGLLALGHLLLDVFAEIPDSPGKLPQGDSVAHLEHVAIEEIMANIANEPCSQGDSRSRIGGGQALVALASRALGLDTCLAACVGADAEGSMLWSWITEYGIIPDISTGKGRTGIFLCLSDKNGGKRILVDPGAAREIRGKEIRRGLFKPGWVLSIDGLLIDSPEWLAETAERARAAGMKVALDLSTASNAARWGVELKDFSARHCDYVFANEAEFEEVQRSAGRIVAPRETWIVKLGRKGSFSFKGTDSWTSKAKTIDSSFDTGAGDFFAAGYLAGCMEGFDEEARLSLGNEVAAKLVQSGESGFPMTELALLGRSILTN